MGKIKGPYRAEYPKGLMVRIRDRSALEAFAKEWGAAHHALQPEQFDLAGSVAVVRDVSYYHGGDELYEFEGISGIWHEGCLEAAPAPAA